MKVLSLATLALLSSFHTLTAATSIAPELVGRLIHACAHGVDPAIQASVVSVESGGNAWILHDNNDGRVYRPANFRSASIFAQNLIESNHENLGDKDSGVDIGLGQINSRNLPSLHASVAQVLDPCANLAISSNMLSQAFHSHLLGSPAMTSDIAWDAALQIYNSGYAHGDEGYVHHVRQAMSSDFVRRATGTSTIAPVPGAQHRDSAEFFETRSSNESTSNTEFYAENGTRLTWNS